MPPFPTAFRPASNCGLTRAISQAPAAATLSAAGSARVRLMKLTSATMAPTGSLTWLRIEAPRVGPLEHHDPGVGAELGVELVAPDIDGIDLGRAAGEQNLGEAPGRGADIERHPPLNLEAEGVERRLEF